MSKDENEIKAGSFIKSHYILLWKHKENLAVAAIYGRIENLTEEFGECTYSEQSLAAWCGISKATVHRAIHWLIKEKYVIDNTPQLKNRTHSLVATSKFYEEEQEFFGNCHAISKQLRRQWNSMEFEPDTPPFPVSSKEKKIVDPYMYRLLSFFPEATEILAKTKTE
jgi:hypothetical protein